jgi:predicted O-methyltransferase YrrM
MNYSKHSLDLTRQISDAIGNQTFHHHYHILYDIANHSDEHINYVEIGCYAGGSACLLLQRPNTTVISIDLGIPIKPEIVMSNVKKLNKLNNEFHYLQGNSQTEDMVNRLKTLVSSIDLLFIDGDHSFKGVLNDFRLYEALVKPGGYIVFDDYLDAKHSPHVRPAVDHILGEIKSSYDIIGCLENKYGARPVEYTQSNDFIIKKR